MNSSPRNCDLVIQLYGASPKAEGLTRAIKAWDLIFTQLQRKAHMTNWSGRSNKMRVRYGGFLYRALGLYRHISVNEFSGLELHVEHRSVVFICCSVVEHFNCKWPLYSVTADRACENCYGTEERQTKQSDMAQWTAYHQEHQNFLEV